MLSSLTLAMSEDATLSNGYAATVASSAASSDKKTLSKVMAASSVTSGTLTPSSTPSRSSFSATSSPVIKPNSRPNSPEIGPKDIPFDRSDLPAEPAPLSLPSSPPPSVPTSPPTSMAEACYISRGTGLMRRLSRGATNASNRIRGRQSATTVLNREQRSGSMIRHGSHSRGFGDASLDVSDLELDYRDDNSVPSFKRAENLDSVMSRSLPRSLSRRSSEKESVVPTAEHDPNVLICTFVRVYKKKKKPFTLSMDKKAAKLFWSTSHRKQIYFDDIRDIREGAKARLYIESSGFDPDEVLPRWMTIVYLDVKAKANVLHLVAPDEATKKLWKSTLWREIRQRGENMAGITTYSEKTWLDQWKRVTGQTHSADPLQAGNATMNFLELKQVCRKFAINKSEKSLKQQFDEVNKDRSGRLYSHQYLEFFRRLTVRNDIRALFEQIKSNSDSTMGINDFLKFLKNSQGIDTDNNVDYWKNIFELFNAKRKELILQNSKDESDDELDFSKMTFESFRDFLYSQHNEALLGSTDQPFLDRPLNEYFVSSSHNTYLKGRQLKGKTDPEAYIEALKKGCRCIEIDCWDGSDGTPQVTHGRTLSSRAPFLHCIQVVKDHAFWLSDYPLTLSLEVHCNNEQQAVMANILRSVLGDMLVLNELDQGCEVLPSPEQLKGKILIKVKKPKQDQQPQPQPPPPPPPPPPTVVTSGPHVAHRRQRSVSAPTPRTELQLASSAANPPIKEEDSIPPFSQAAHTSTFPIAVQSGRTSLASRPDFSEYSSSDETTDSESEGQAQPVGKKKPSTSKIIGVLGDMGIYTRGVRFSSLRHPESKLFNHIYSLDERKFTKLCENPETLKLLHKHNLRYLMRVYPHAKRYDSRNFNPLQFWRHGVQMVATNWQTRDLGSEIYDAMFAAGTDRTGYVLKPEELRTYKDENSTDPKRKARKQHVKFSVEIISAQSLEAPFDLNPESGLNPYIELEMYSAEDQARGLATATGGTDASAKHGKSGLDSPVRRRTNIVVGNGYDPIFNQAVELSLKTKYPGLVFVRWAARHSFDGKTFGGGKEPLGVFTAKLSSLAPGYRHIPLFNKNGEEIHSKLFCRIKKEECQDVEETFSLVSEEQQQQQPLPQPQPQQQQQQQPKPSRAYFKRVFARTPSDRKRSKDFDDGFFARFDSFEKA